MNLAEEFTRLHEAWNSAGVVEAPRARHAFAVFCHENAEAIVSGLRDLRTLNPNAPLTAIGADLDKIGKSLGGEFSRRYMNDGRKPDFTTGIPLESDAEYRERILRSGAFETFDIEAERPAFEQWAQDEHGGMIPLDRSDRGLGYRNNSIQAAWIGWCARAKQSAEKMPAPIPEFDIASFQKEMVRLFHSSTTFTVHRENGFHMEFAVPNSVYLRALSFCMRRIPGHYRWTLSKERE